MIRYIKITIFTLVCVCFNINKMYACDQDPIPVITSDPNAFKIYMHATDSITLVNNSYDPDDGTDPGDGIVEWNWNIYDYNEYGDSYYIRQGVDVNSSCTFSPSAFGLGAGHYAVDLIVKDNDGIWVSGYGYYGDTNGNWSGTRDFYVPGIHYFGNEHNEIVHYLPTGTGETFKYSLIPGPESDWEPTILTFYILDAENNYVYVHSALGSMVNDPNIPLEGTIIWNGLGNFGSYNNLPLPPGNYTVTLYVNKNGITAYEANPLTVVGIEKIQYKIGSDPYQDCPNPFVVARMATVKFKAVMNPPGATWPYNKPSWYFDGTPMGYTEQPLSFNSASSSPDDYIVIQAECGNTIPVNIVVVELTSLEINAKRTTGPVESSFPVKYNEHFELGATFQFDLNLGEWPTPVKMGAEIWDLDWFNKRLVYGTGTSISHTFGTGTYGSYDDGTCDVCFYFDEDTSGGSSEGDAQVDSYDFEVQELKYHYLNFAKSSEVNEVPTTTAVCIDVTERIRKKDTADDWRATAMIIPEGSLSTIPATDTQTPPELHDPVKVWRHNDGTIDDEWGHAAYFRASSADVIIVNEIWACFENGDRDYDHFYQGLSHSGAQPIIQIEDFNGKTLSHELGHFFGLNHNDSNEDNVMHSEIFGYGTLLDLDETDNYDE